MIALERAQEFAEAITKKLEPYCEKIQIAGSVRRKKPWVNDLDFVLIPKDIWNLHHEIMGLCRPFPAKVSGKKIMRVQVNGIQVDFYFASPETWATLLLIRTGSAENNIRLCSLAKKKNWQLHANGDGLFDEKGQRIAGDSEASIFEALGLDYISPEGREVGKKQ